MNSNILIVEGDVALSNGIVLTLKCKDDVFSQVFTIKSAKKKIHSNTFNLIILDINNL